MRLGWIAVVVCLLVGVAAPATGAAEGTASHAAGVVAVIDTGINPYNKVFRDDSPLAYQHPSTYLPGFPEDAIALELTFTATNYKAAVKADCERVWSKLKPRQIYWIPGTRIVGAISFGSWASEWVEGSKVDCAKEDTAAALLLDQLGHGTMTASRAVGGTYGACRTCRLVVVQIPEYGSAGALPQSGRIAADAVEWASKQNSWIDAQSNSWAPTAPSWDPSGTALDATPDFVRRVEVAARRHPAFWASGNGAAGRYGGAGHPTMLDPHFTPTAIPVGGHDSGQMITWSGLPPRFVGDACESWAASHTSIIGQSETLGEGTSGATPFVAGTAVAMLAQARSVLGQRTTGVHDGVVARGPAGRVPSGPLADGVFTLAEWRRLMEVTASRRPAKQVEDGPACGPDRAPWLTTPVRWVDVPDQYPEYVQIGYGALDREALALAGKVLAGTAPSPDRTATDTYFAADGQVRDATYPLFSGG